MVIIICFGWYEGYFFVVFINLVCKVVCDFWDYGVVQWGIFGVFIDEMINEMVKCFNFDVVEGVYINCVMFDSGVDDVGLIKGDVIIGINGVKIKILFEMQEQLGCYCLGNVIKIEIICDGNWQDVEVIFKNKSNSIVLVIVKNEDILFDLGFEFWELIWEEQCCFDVDGVKVISIYWGSWVECINMDFGFVIIKIDNCLVDEVEDLVNYLECVFGKIMLEGIYEGYFGEYYYVFLLD